MIEFKEEHHDKLRSFPSVPIQSEVLNLTSEHPSSEDNFERKFQDKISPSEQSFYKPEEELIELKGEHQDELIKFSLVTIET